MLISGTCRPNTGQVWMGFNRVAILSLHKLSQHLSRTVIIASVLMFIHGDISLSILVPAQARQFRVGHDSFEVGFTVKTD